MPAQKGREFLLKLGDGASPEVFTTIGGFTSNSLTINDEPVDVTNKSSVARWRELLAEAGVRSVETSGSGRYIAGTQEKALVTAIMGTNSHSNYQVVVPGLGTFEGAFHLSSVELDGPDTDGVNKSVSLVSAGQITFSAEA